LALFFRKIQTRDGRTALGTMLSQQSNDITNS
jgi:hypothetical protein